MVGRDTILSRLLVRRATRQDGVQVTIHRFLRRNGLQKFLRGLFLRHPRCSSYRLSQQEDDRRLGDFSTMRTRKDRFRCSKRPSFLSCPRPDLLHEVVPVHGVKEAIINIGIEKEDVRSPIGLLRPDAREHIHHDLLRVDRAP